MGLFDSYFDPQQFQDSGGLLGRLLSLQQTQGRYQPDGDFNSQSAAGGQPSSTPQASVSASPQPAAPALAAALSNPQTPDYGQTQNVAVGNYQMPLFGGTDVAQASQQPPDLGDRLSAGFQSWAHTPLGNPFAALANGIAGLGSGQRTDPAADGSQDLNSKYQALRPILGDHNAMLAIVHPDVGKTLITQALAGQTDPGNDASSTAGGQPPGLAPAIAASLRPGYAPRGTQGGAMASRPNLPGGPRSIRR